MAKKNINYLEMAQDALKQGADLNIIDKEGYSLLMRVIMEIPTLCVTEYRDTTEEHESTVNLAIQLMDKGASIAGELGVRCLCLANRSKRLCEELVRRGVSVNGIKLASRPAHERYPLVSVADADDDLEMFKWFREQGAELSADVGAECLIRAITTESVYRWNKDGIVEQLLAQGIDPNIPNDNGEYPINVAAEQAKSLYELLVKSGADTKFLDSKQRSKLINDDVCSAIESKDAKKAVEILRSTQSDVTLAQFDGDLQLIHKAALYGMGDVIKVLIEKGANVNAVNAAKNTALHYLLDADRLTVEAVKILLNSGANVNARNEDKTIPLFYMRNFNTDNHHYKIRCQVIRLMIEQGADISGAVSQELFGKVIAAKENDLAMLMLQKGIDSSEGLIQAIEGKNWEMVEYFKKQGKKTENRAKEILDILCDQIESPESIALAKECLEHISDVNEIRSKETQNTFLIYCAIHNTPNIAAMLIERGANLEQAAKNGSTPLERAVAYECVEMVELLLNRGADVKSEGLLLLCTAVKQKNLRILKLLLEKSVNPNGVRDGSTPLQRAVENKSSPLVDLLLQYKADANLKGDDADYPLVMAIKSGNCEIIHQLLLSGADSSIEIKKKITIADLGKASKKEGVSELFNLTPEQLKTYKPKKDALIFTNQRMLFAIGVENWSDVIKAQVKKVFNKMPIDTIKEEAGEIEYVDVIDAETNKGIYQLMTFNFGDGALLSWDKTTVVGNIVQHGFEVAKAMSDEAASKLSNMLDEANRNYGGVEQGINFSE